MTPALATTAADLGAALTMQPRQKPVLEIVKQTWTTLVRPAPTGIASRLWHRHMLNIAIWAMTEMNWTDEEIESATGKDEFYRIFAAGDVQRLRDQTDNQAFREFTDAVLAKLEDEL